MVPLVDVRPADGACDLLFVYGSLCRGASHHHALERLRARLLEPGSVCGGLYSLGPFPGARPAAPDLGAPASDTDQAKPAVGARRVPRVFGELYQLQNPTRDLKVLDSYEGFRPFAPERSLFRREVAEVWRRGRSAMPAWIYWLNTRPAPACLIPAGKYACRSKEPFGA